MKEHHTKPQNDTIENKLPSLAELTAGVAHEVSNPLSIIQGTLEQISLHQYVEKNDQDQLVNKLNIIKKNCSRINTVINGLKTLSIGTHLENSSYFTVNSIVDEALSFCHNNMEDKAILIETDIKSNFKLFCNSNEITQVLYNLITNSIHAISNQKNPWIKINTYSISGSNFIDIQDSGLGIPENIASKMFTPFFSTKKPDQGMGLGLGICSRIMSSYGGLIFLNHEKANTTITLKFQNV